MTAINADGTTFTFNGVEVGGITAYEFLDGATPQIAHQPLGGPREYRPGVPEYGRVRVTLYRDPQDPGQIEMESARTNRQTQTAVLTLIDGTERTFPANVEVLPIVGNDINGVSTARVVLKVAGAVS